MPLAQANPALQMFYYDTSITQNGLPIVQAATGSEWMEADDSLADRVSYSIYIVLSYQTSASQFQQILRAETAGGSAITIKGNAWTSFPPGANGRVWFGSSDGIVAAPDAVDNWQILHFHLDHQAETGEIYRNNSLLGTQTYDVAVGQQDQDWTIGWSANEHGLEAFLAEIAIYRGDRPHDAGERAAKVAALNTKWAVF